MIIANENLINKIATDVSDDYTYFTLGNNNNKYYGNGGIYNKVYKNTEVNYILSRYVEMNGKIVPVRNKKHAVQGALYEVFNTMDPTAGYPIEWDGRRWLFESPTSMHVSDKLKNSITPDMYEKNIDTSLLSSPNDEGLRQDSENNKYIKINDNFVRIIQGKTQYFIRKENGEKLYLELRDGKFFPENMVPKTGGKIFKRNVGSDCPDWQKLYDQLGDIASKDKIITVRHRGDSDTNVAENSLSAFRLSYKMCRPAIETDVLLTKDNQPVIFHDVRIGKMMEPTYDPDRNTGSNVLLSQMMLAELKRKPLLDPRRRPTRDTIITVEELLRDYREQNGQALLYLEVKEPKLIMRVAKIITDEAKSDPTLIKRVIVKFNMAEYPTYVDWVAGLRDIGADINIMANPVMSPAAAERINKLPESAIAKPEGDPLHDNASRAVYWWSSAHGQNVPNVEIVIKNSKSGFIKTQHIPSVQGGYDRPENLYMNNTIPGSPAYMIAIVKKNGKPLGTYVPVGDRIMWRDDVVSGVTVPNTSNHKKRIDITKAYYNNDSQCCYSLKDRLAKNELEDIRENLAWNRAIGANVITADDTDSIDNYFAKRGNLDKISIPNPHYPRQSMQSTLAWALQYWSTPDGVTAKFKGWGGGSSPLIWNGQVCIYDNSYSKYPWVYACKYADKISYSNKLKMRVIENVKYGAVNQIYSNDDKFCLSGRDGDTSYLKFTSNCNPENTETHFWHTENYKLRNLYTGDDTKYIEFYRGEFIMVLHMGCLEIQIRQTIGQAGIWKK